MLGSGKAVNLLLLGPVPEVSTAAVHCIATSVHTEKHVSAPWAAPNIPINKVTTRYVSQDAFK